MLPKVSIHLNLTKLYISSPLISYSTPPHTVTMNVSPPLPHPLPSLPNPPIQLTPPTPQIVEWAFGKRMTPQERLRKHQRALEKTQRELDRERTKLENQEKKLVADIKKSAKNGQMGACKIQAKDLVRTRRYGSCSSSFEVQFIASYVVASVLIISSTQIHPKILRNAHPTASHLPPHPNRPLQRTNDAINERRHLPPRVDEQIHEPPSAPTHSDGIRKGKRCDGSAAGDDG